MKLKVRNWQQIPGEPGNKLLVPGGTMARRWIPAAVLQLHREVFSLRQLLQERQCADSGMLSSKKLHVPDEALDLQARLAQAEVALRVELAARAGL